MKINLKVSAAIRKANDKLDDLCKSFGFRFILNFEITGDLLCNDGFLLKEKGTYILASNFVYFLHDYI